MQPQLLEICNHGSIVTIRGLTPEVADHLAEHMPEHMPGPVYYVEPRYVQFIIDDVEETFL